VVGLRNQIFCGLIFKWHVLDGLSPEVVLDRCERWYEQRYRAGGSTLAEHMAECVKTLASVMRGRLKFNCKKYASLWHPDGDVCDLRPSHPAPGPTERIIGEARRTAHAFRMLVESPILKGDTLAQNIFRYFARHKGTAEVLNAPRFMGQPVLYAIQEHLARLFETTQPTVSRAIGRLVEAKLLRRVDRKWFFDRYEGARLDYLRDRGHWPLMPETWMPRYYIVNDYISGGWETESTQVNLCLYSPETPPGFYAERHHPVTQKEHQIQVPLPVVEPFSALPIEFRRPDTTARTEKLSTGALERLQAHLQVERDAREEEILREVRERLSLQEYER
jgi:hypothetical protein